MKGWWGWLMLGWWGLEGRRSLAFSAENAHVRYVVWTGRNNNEARAVMRTIYVTKATKTTILSYL